MDKEKKLEELKKVLPSSNFEGLKKTIDSIDNFGKDIKMPDLSKIADIGLDPKTGVLYEIVKRIEKVEKNTKRPLWKDVLMCLISGVIGGGIAILISIFGF